MGNQTYNSLITVLSEDIIAKVFLFYMMAVLVLNIIKTIILWVFREREIIDKPCEFLSNEGGISTCKNSSHAQSFKWRNNSCKGCFGKSINQSKESIERKAKKSGIVVFLIITLADIGRVVLPYASILFTLLSKISITKP